MSAFYVALWFKYNLNSAHSSWEGAYITEQDAKGVLRTTRNGTRARLRDHWT